MKFFAITPDNANIDHLIDLLPELGNRGATHLYIRLFAASRVIRPLIEAVAFAGIVPIVPYVIYKRDMLSCSGVHYKSSEISLLSQRLPASPRVITASSHSSMDARLALQSGAHYVYVSPVYAPLSKPGDRRPLISRDELQNLIAVHGERIVLLGGITQERMKKLAEAIIGDFSVAGITLSFGDSVVH